MSWQEYVDSALVGTGKISEAAIIGHDGTLWAQSPSFTINPDQFTRLFQSFTNPSIIRSEGLKFGNDKVQVYRPLVFT